MKRFLSLVLVLIMVLSVLQVSAAETVKITVGSGKQFEKLTDAFEEADAKQYANVTFEIYGKLTLENDADATIDAYAIGSRQLQEVHFVGMTADAEIFVDDPLSKDTDYGTNDNGYTGLEAVTAGLVTFEKLTLNHNKYRNKVVQANDRLSTFWYVNSKKTQIYTDCTFKNTMISDAKEAIFKNCKFVNTRTGGYSIFYRGGGKNSELTLENCSFDAPRGVKLYTEGNGEQISAINVTGCTFMVTEKAAFEVEPSVVLPAAEVVFKDNTFNYCKPVNNASLMYLNDEDIAKNNSFNKVRPDSSLMYTGSDVKYYKGGDEVKALSAGDITAKTSVTNNWKVDLPVTVITAEYRVTETGLKILVQMKRNTQTIAEGKTVEFENTITIGETAQRMVKTMVIPADYVYPIASVQRLVPDAELRGEYVGTEKDESNINVHVYRIESNGFDYGDA